MRRSVQILGWTLIWSGIFLFGYLGWQLYGTDVVNARVQTEAKTTLERRLAVGTAPEVEEVEEEGVVVEHVLEDVPGEGVGFAMLRVPKVGLEAVVFEGVTKPTLAKGPGHMPGTPLPGQPGNAVISGHRTTYGRPFHDFDLLVPGDRVEVDTGIGTHVYEVRESFIVAPTDVWVTDSKPGAWLTFTTCNPKYSATERLIVTAELVAGPNAEYVHQLATARSPA
ncbi:MAG TPA: sortase [Acidimicrobiia bacterium]|jgi:sortase A|nr:sortase [Acidimicrobiia bacterium]